jgi:WD40 repeat protein/serine/threonine protein kinase
MKEDSAKTFLHYEIKETLQKSPEGIVYRAVDQGSGGTVLIKRYYPAMIWSEPVMLEFLKWVDYLRFIEHEYLLPVIDFGKHEGVPYIVYADDSLTLLSAHPVGQPVQEETLQFLHGVAQALDILHRQEIIHGSLSPENTALDVAGNPKIFDVGLTAIFKSVLHENMDDGFQNLCISNSSCISPEQFQGLTPTRASDIYALGILGYYYIFGEFPRELHDTDAAVSPQGKGIGIQKVRLPGDISETTVHLIEKCIQSEPKDRFTSMAHVLKALDRLLAGRKNRMHFKRRFAVEKAFGPARHVGRYIVAFILLASLVASLYLFLSPPLSVSVTPTGGLSFLDTPARQKATPTQPIKPTASPARSVSTPTEPVQTAAGNRPAIENEPPLLPSQPISLANLSALREISRLGTGRPDELAVSPDSVTLAVAESTGVYIFRNNRLFTWLDPGSWATSVQFSLDGTTLAVGLLSGDIQLWDWKAGTKTAVLSEHTAKINRILYSKTGMIYSASADGNIIVWDAGTNEVFGPIINAHSRPVNDIAGTDDGRIIVSCSDDGLIRVWDVNSRKKLYELRFSDRGSKPKALALTYDRAKDEAYFAVGGDSGYIYQYNLVDSPSITNPHPTLRTDPIPVAKRIWNLEYIREGAEILAGVEGGSTERFNAYRMDYPGVARNFEILSADENLTDVFGSGFDFASSAAMFGGNIATSNWNGEVVNQSTSLTFPLYDILDRLDISRGGNTLAAGGRRGTIQIWDITTNKPLYHDNLILPRGDPISPDGASIAIMVPREVKKSVTTGNIITEYFYRMMQLSGSQTKRDFSLAVPEGQVSYARDGAIFAAGNLEKSTTWDFSSSYETESAGYGINTGCRATVSKNDRNEVIQVYSPAGYFSEWREPNASNLCQLASRFGGALSSFSNNLELFLYKNSDKGVEAYQVADNKQAWKYNHKQEITTVAVSPDGKIVALGDGSGNLLLLDGATGSLKTQIQGNYGGVRAIKFSEDGKLIITAGEDGAVRVFGIAGAN